MPMRIAYSGRGVRVTARRRTIVSIVALLCAHLVATTAPATAAELAVERLAGANRYATAAEVSRTQFPTGAPLAFIATGTNYADALTISAAAAGLGPVLLVERDRLPDETAKELARLEPIGIIVVGGPVAVSEQTMIDVARYAGRETRRIAGPDRFSTATAISREAFDAGTEVAFVTNGTAFQDALGATASAAAFGAPLLLTNPTSLPATTEEELRRLAPERIVVVGGPSDVDDGVVERLRGLAANVVRVGGEDDEATSASLSRATFTSSGIAFLATSATFPDGLTGGAFAGAVPAPLMLVTRDEVSDSVKCELVRLGAESVVVLGGPSTISDRVVTELEGGYEAADIPGCDA